MFIIEMIACHIDEWQAIISIMNIQMKREGRDSELVKAFDYVEEIVNYLVTNTQ